MFESANNLILKITKGCNLNCSYCYVKHKEENKNVFMSFGTFKNVIERVIEDKKKYTVNDTIGIIFHGGEPLTAGIKTLGLMFNYIEKRFEEEKLDFFIGMQTNLTLLNEDFAALLSKYNVRVGASFDGLKKANIARTSIFKQSDYFKKFKMLEQFKVPYGLLMVVGSHNYKHVKKSVDYINKKLGKSIKVNFAQDVNNIGGEVDGETFFKYGIKPFVDDFIKSGYSIEGNTEQYIKSYITSRLVEPEFKNRTNCGGKVCGAGLNIIEVNPDGELELCGRFAETTPESYIDDIESKDFLRLKQFKKYFNFAEIKHEKLLDKKCDSCYADDICDHGCMAFHFVKTGEYGIRTDLICPIYKELYKYLLKNENEILDAFLEKRKGNLIPLSAKIKRVKTESGLYKHAKNKGYRLEINSGNELIVKKE